jgi:hypothetical protein
MGASASASGQDAYLAPVTKETDVIDPGSVCALRSREEQCNSREVGKFRCPKKT